MYLTKIELDHLLNIKGNRGVWG